MISFLLNLVGNSTKKFNNLYKKYKNYIFVICNNILNDLSLSEDATQDTFISINNNLKKVEDINSNRTKGYIAIIARHKAIDLYNKKNNIVFVEDEIFSNNGVEIDPLENMYYENLLNLIRNLKVEYSNILMLRFVHEMEYKEIAITIGISESAARKRVERAKKALQTALEGDNNE
ncbi:RNA polymerase sigma factor [Miniphocaeibacter massiliensis]|uniref:RNA polymerase sigma factor n=1 Tax=Miniphocaeibacter massiliensis TaxID=2041841 RepID=UPI000C1C0843|nr:sigma-70 family RNA polymerase sigma factor [Miniphocaeibacter massiliensis]